MIKQPKQIIDKLIKTNNATDAELLFLLDNMNAETQKYLSESAAMVAKANYDDKIFMRGLIEFSSYCNKGCLYCGINKANTKADRYRLTKEEILLCCQAGWDLGYQTFVLQAGEDPFYTDEVMVDIILEIKKQYPKAAITLGLGERSYESYQKLYDAGADRYLLRHETADQDLYAKLHPDLKLENRVQCLKNLQEIGYQTGAGFMVGLPGQTNEKLVKDLRFVKELQPEMCGIGPFIPHHATVLANEKGGTLDQTLQMVALTRLLLPKALLPATTALGTIDNLGREKGIKAGANVVMPNLSPTDVRDKYLLYDNKICTGDEAAECRNCIEMRINMAGYQVEVGRGDHKLFEKEAN